MPFVMNEETQICYDARVESYAELMKFEGRSVSAAKIKKFVFNDPDLAVII